MCVLLHLILGIICCRASSIQTTSLDGIGWHEPLTVPASPAARSSSATGMHAGLLPVASMGCASHSASCLSCMLKVADCLTGAPSTVTSALGERAHGSTSPLPGSRGMPGTQLPYHSGSVKA